jgi:hypothetical protein
MVLVAGLENDSHRKVRYPAVVTKQRTDLMAAPESPIPTHLISGLLQSLQQMVAANRQSAVATLTAAIVAKAGKSMTVSEVLDIQRDLCFAMYPEAGSGAYVEWKKTDKERLAKTY